MPHRIRFFPRFAPAGKSSAGPVRPLRELVGLVIVPALLAPVLLGGAAAKPAPLPAGQPAAFRTYCIGCHSMSPDGKMPRLDGLRATPEEWDLILRRMGRRGLTLTPDERKALVKEITKTRSLAPEEHAAIGYINISPAANIQETVPNHGDFRATCVSCHSWAKIASHRRSPENWKALRDFHLAQFPASLTQSFREIQWWDTAVEATNWLGGKLPYETPEWQRWQARKGNVKAAGSWIVSGHAPTMGDYEATMRLTPRGDDEFDLVREVRWASGQRETLRGKATLYGGCALRAEWQQGQVAVKAAYTLAPDGQGLGGRAADMVGSWQVHHVIHRYGTESGGRLRAKAGGPLVLGLSPSWVRQGGRVDVVATTDGPVPTGWAPKIAAGNGVKLLGARVVDATHVKFTLSVAANAKRGALPLGLNAATRPGGERADMLTVVRDVDYVKVAPEKGTARLGGQAVPPDGVAYEAIAYSNGPDGARHTGDDLRLGPVPARWALQEAHATMEDDDLALVGTIGADGVFVPGHEGAAKSYTLGNNGQVWVVATVDRPGKRPLTARGYLLVTAPDLVKTIR